MLYIYNIQLNQFSIGMKFEVGNQIGLPLQIGSQKHDFIVESLKLFFICIKDDILLYHNNYYLTNFPTFTGCRKGSRSKG